MTTIWSRSKELRNSGALYEMVVRRGLKPGSVRTYWLVLAAITLLDQSSKWVVSRSLQLYESIPLLGEFLRLTYIRNPGASFSLLANYHSPWRLVLFIGIAVLAVVALTILAYREKRRGPALLAPLGLVSGGALGNMIDRATVGTVVDFIEFSYKSFHFPVFNLADSAVNVGVAWLLWMTFREKPEA